MQTTYCESIRKIMQNKERIESELEVKLINKGRVIFIEGQADKEFIALEILEALNLGFTIEQTLDLKKEDFVFQTLNIKNLTKRGDLVRIRARIIGSLGKTLNTLENLTDCQIAVHDNDIGIIGKSTEVKDAIQAITSIVRGSKQANVYARLEKRKKYKSYFPYEVSCKDNLLNKK